MVQLIKPHQVKVVTSQGECQVHLTLDLNINLTADDIKVAVQGGNANSPTKQEEDDEFKWAIPDFEDDDDSLDFGKKV